MKQSKLPTCEIFAGDIRTYFRLATSAQASPRHRICLKTQLILLYKNIHRLELTISIIIMPLYHYLLLANGSTIFFV